MLDETIPSVVQGTKNDDGEDDNGGEDNRDGDGDQIPPRLTDLCLNTLKWVDDAEIRDLARHSDDGRKKCVS